MKKITLFSVLMILLCFITGILGACSDKGDHNEPSDNRTRIQMSFNGETVFVTLNNNSATQDLIARLQIAPITLLFRDFDGSEKIGYPEPALDVSDVSGCDPDVGDLTIYKPWGNLAAFYRDTAGYSDSLVPIGKIENGGIELLAAQSGEFSVTFAIV